MGPMIVRETSIDAVRPRVWVAAAVILLAMGVLVARLWQLQFIDRASYTELSLTNRTRLIRLPPTRGRILDANGAPLAVNHPSFTLSIVPAEVNSPRDVIRVCSPPLGLTPEKMRELTDRSLSAPRFFPFPLKKNISLEEISLIKSRAAGLDGLAVETASYRTYPQSQSLCHVIGTVGEISQGELSDKDRFGYRPGDVVGKTGLEAEYETYLRGVEGWESIEIDAKGRQLSRTQGQKPVAGADLKLTIDVSLQKFVEQVFTERAGSVVVVEADTGRIVSMFSKPGFDLNLFSPSITQRHWKTLKEDPLHPLENRSTRGLYSPASTFKIVTAAAALAEGVISPEEKIECKGKMELWGQFFRCWNQYGHGKIALHDALVESCDIYFYRLGLRLGADRIARYASLFGMGKPTGVGLPHELPGLIPTSTWKRRTYGRPWKDGETLAIAIGQGYLTCTPIQIAMMTAAVANDGILMKPAIVRRIQGSDGRIIYEHTPVVRSRLPLKPEDLARLKRALRAVVSEPKGTGKRAKIPGLNVSGKTGTSQVIRMRQNPVEGELIPYHERTHAIFVAYVDDRPKKIAVVVIAEHGGPGGKNAAPIARKIISRYYGVADPGDEEEPAE